MWLIKNIFKKDKKVFYSCVVDDHAKCYWHGYIFVNSLIRLAGVDGSSVFVHLTKNNEQFENFLNFNKVNIKHIEPWGDKKYCNKLQQLQTTEFRKADYVFFCDADISIVEDLAPLVKGNKGKILGKVVDFDNPPLSVLRKIFDFFGVKYPNVSTETLNGCETFEVNFNGGLYGVPANKIDRLGKMWRSYAFNMLESAEIRDLLADKINHVDQISFALALGSLGFEYTLLGYEYNCPTHIKNSELLSAKLKTAAKVIHYHGNISPVGLLNSIDSRYVSMAIDKINNMLEALFDNSFFWNYRYATNPELGSGIGSRGETAHYKLKLLKNIGLEKSDSVLDLGCGDLEIVKNLHLQNYAGVDISDVAIQNARGRYPHLAFFHYELEKDEIPQASTVVCLDVAIHQPSRTSYEQLIEFIASRAICRVVVSGYEQIQDNSHMCFFYENIKDSLEKTGLFKYVFKVGEYRGLSVYIADKGELCVQKTPNDMSNSMINEVLKAGCVDRGLILEAITVSRGAFGWFTKHYPRLYEYPWLLGRLGQGLKGFKIADFGAGVTPLPLLLSQRGATVFTLDKHSTIHNKHQIDRANEWGFLDYSCFDDAITSRNDSLSEGLFEDGSLDAWYSISVVEHMPASMRRQILSNMACSLREGGAIFLTVDLAKDSNYLWNMSEGREVEEKAEHGTLDDLVSELEDLGLVIFSSDVKKMPRGERVDIALIEAHKGRKAEQ